MLGFDPGNISVTFIAELSPFYCCLVVMHIFKFTFTFHFRCMKHQSELKAAEEQLPVKVAPEKAEPCCFLAKKDKKIVCLKVTNK